MTAVFLDMCVYSELLSHLVHDSIAYVSSNQFLRLDRHQHFPFPVITLLSHTQLLLQCSQVMEENTHRLLRLVIEGATNLAKKDIFGASDPYVIIYKEQDSTLFRTDVPFYLTPANEIARTAIISRTLNPHWNESFDVVMEPGKALVLEVFDKNRITRDDFLGRTHFNPTSFFVKCNLDVFSTQFPA